jgi:hypothetical protein
MPASITARRLLAQLQWPTPSLDEQGMTSWHQPGSQEACIIQVSPGSIRVRHLCPQAEQMVRLEAQWSVDEDGVARLLHHTVNGKNRNPLITQAAVREFVEATDGIKAAPVFQAAVPRARAAMAGRF